MRQVTKFFKNVLAPSPYPGTLLQWLEGLLRHRCHHVLIIK